MYRLVCGRDARKLGIENEKGDWDLKKLEKHIAECKVCQDFVDRLVFEVMKEVSAKKGSN